MARGGTDDRDKAPATVRSRYITQEKRRGQTKVRPYRTLQREWDGLKSAPTEEEEEEVGMTTNTRERDPTE